MDLDMLHTPPPEITYPPILPFEQYSLITDPVHQYGKRGEAINDEPAVLVPELNIRFQLAREAPQHLWPHNAIPLGFVRYIPTREGLGKKIPLPKGSGCYKFYHSHMESESVLFSFMYTHPDPNLNCDSCIKDKLDCVHVEWDWPNVTAKPPTDDIFDAPEGQYLEKIDNSSLFTWPGKHTEALIALKCYCCRVNGRSDCSNVGRLILLPDQPKFEDAEQAAKQIAHERLEYRKRLGIMRTSLTVNKYNYIIEAVEPVRFQDPTASGSRPSRTARIFDNVSLDETPSIATTTSNSTGQKRKSKARKIENADERVETHIDVTPLVTRKRSPPISKRVRNGKPSKKRKRDTTSSPDDPIETTRNRPAAITRVPSSSENPPAPLQPSAPSNIAAIPTPRVASTSNTTSSQPVRSALTTTQLPTLEAENLALQRPINQIHSTHSQELADKLNTQRRAYESTLDKQAKELKTLRDEQKRLRAKDKDSNLKLMKYQKIAREATAEIERLKAMVGNYKSSEARLETEFREKSRLLELKCRDDCGVYERRLEVKDMEISMLNVDLRNARGEEKSLEAMKVAKEQVEELVRVKEVTICKLQEDLVAARKRGESNGTDQAYRTLRELCKRQEEKLRIKEEENARLKLESDRVTNMAQAVLKQATSLDQANCHMPPSPISNASSPTQPPKAATIDSILNELLSLLKSERAGK